MVFLTLFLERCRRSRNRASHARWEAYFFVLPTLGGKPSLAFCDTSRLITQKHAFFASHRAWEAQKKRRPSTFFRRLEKIDVVRIFIIFVNITRSRMQFLKSRYVFPNTYATFCFGWFRPMFYVFSGTSVVLQISKKWTPFLVISRPPPLRAFFKPPGVANFLCSGPVLEPPKNWKMGPRKITPFR